MLYTIKHSEWQWLIEPRVNGKRYALRYRRPTRWRDCKTFPSPEAAAAAVATGKTGLKEWDTMKRDKPFPSLAEWLIDPTGSALSTFSTLLSGDIPTQSPPAGGS
jgi:hypothetical protein